MTHFYAAKRLLEHGPLSRKEFVQITGWNEQVAANVLYLMTKSKEVVPFVQSGSHRWMYRLA